MALDESVSTPALASLDTFSSFFCDFLSTIQLRMVFLFWLGSFSACPTWAKTSGANVGRVFRSGR